MRRRYQPDKRFEDKQLESAGRKHLTRSKSLLTTGANLLHISRTSSPLLPNSQTLFSDCHPYHPTAPAHHRKASSTPSQPILNMSQRILNITATHHRHYRNESSTSRNVSSTCRNTLVRPSQRSLDILQRILNIINLTTASVISYCKPPHPNSHHREDSNPILTRHRSKSATNSKESE